MQAREVCEHKQKLEKNQVYRSRKHFIASYTFGLLLLLNFTFDAYLYLRMNSVKRETPGDILQAKLSNTEKEVQMIKILLSELVKGKLVRIKRRASSCIISTDRERPRACLEHAQNMSGA